MITTQEIPSSLTGTYDIRHLIAWNLSELATGVKDKMKMITVSFLLWGCGPKVGGHGLLIYETSVVLWPKSGGPWPPHLRGF